MAKDQWPLKKGNEASRKEDDNVGMASGQENGLTRNFNKAFKEVRLFLSFFLSVIAQYLACKRRRISSGRLPPPKTFLFDGVKQGPKLCLRSIRRLFNSKFEHNLP